MNQNGHSEIRENAHSPHADIGVEDNPYIIRRRPARPETEEALPEGVTRGIGAAENEIILEELGEEARPKRDRKMRYVFAAFLSLVIVGAVAFAYTKLGGATKIDHHVKLKNPGGLTPQAQHLQGETTDQQIEAAIAQAKEARRSVDEAGSLVSADEASRRDSTAESPAPALPRISMPGEYVGPTEGRISAVEARGIGLDRAEQPGAAHALDRTAGQPRHNASSVYTGAGDEPKAPAASMAAAPVQPGPKLQFNWKDKAITLPSFGAMLPVRTLGAIYTLRNSLARLELTRDIAGEGWALKKGTVLIAQQQGGALDRAYVSLTGFIDPSTNRFVKMTGEVLGNDGAPGLKGKRRQISGRWSRAFNRILNIAPGIAQAALARNGGTTVIAPTGGVANDLIATGEFSSDRREFVEVEAGSSGYVMVTDLPDIGKGIDADPEKYLAGGGQGSLSDQELAMLLSEGAPHQIKAAMPRMTPEMRRVAALAIGEPEK